MPDVKFKSSSDEEKKEEGKPISPDAHVQIIVSLLAS